MKRLVICFDGTWNNADNPGAETHVARIGRAICPSDGNVPQIALYLRGVGTTGLQLDRWLEGATGFGVDDNIRSGYMFLAQNYEPGDQIFLFGFSRGSFTARSLVGLISAAGLMRRESLAKLGAAWAYYRTRKPHDPAAFARQAGVVLHEGVKIDFLGVWDTVGAMGIPGLLFAALNRRQFGFYDTSACPILKRGAHAMAIDEHRYTFVPTLWTGTPPPGASIDQVWFAGVHSDVGGGYADHALADIPLDWMARQAMASGLKLTDDQLPDPARLDPLAPQHDSCRGLFALNHLRPTYRELCQVDFPVPFYQRRYRAVGADGQPVTPINEAIHASVIARYGKTIGSSRYAPPNLAALFDDAGRLRPGIAVAS